MPRPIGRGQRYMPGVDGLRAIAVAAVVLFHEDVSWLPGGLLGVGIFFTLSGYLITDLLLDHRNPTGGLPLRTFWLRRARRLLPALFVMLAVVLLWVAIGDRAQLGDVRSAALSAALYVNNWWQIAHHVSYFARFGPPSPLDNLWSLAVEEQFYLVWPWLLLGGLVLTARRARLRAGGGADDDERQVGPSPDAQRHEAGSAGAGSIGAGSIGDGQPATVIPQLASLATPLEGPPGALRALVRATLASARLRLQTAAPRPEGTPLGTTGSGVPPSTAGTGAAPGGDGRPELRPRQWLDGRGLLLLGTLVLAVASVVEMAALAHPSLNPTRVYDGTDTRAFELLFGAALAMVWPSTRLPELGHRTVLAIDAAGVVGLATIAVLLARTSEYSIFLYRGGFVLLTAATLLVLVAVTHPATRLSRVLGWGPLRTIGLISYGIYLWHYPIIILTTPAGAHGTNPLRATLQVAATVVVAALSWRFVETPIRGGALGRLWHRAQARLRRATPLPARTWVVTGTGALAVAAACATVAGALPAAPAGTLAAASVDRASPDPRGLAPVRSIHRVNPPRAGQRSPSSGSAATRTVGAAAPPRTSCTAVAHLGDSTSESLVSDAYLPTDEQLPAQYARVGVTTVALEIVGGTSIVETLPGDQNGYELAQGLLAQGFKGCWVIALGTNDAADIAVGSRVDAAQRIQRMMDLIGDQPVLWVNTITLVQSGPYAESNMAAWDQALVQACPAYPTMRVYNWAAVAQPSWFISDGIHYTSAGSAARAADIANALAAAFPAGAPPPGSSTSTGSSGGRTTARSSGRTTAGGSGTNGRSQQTRTSSAGAGGGTSRRSSGGGRSAGSGGSRRPGSSHGSTGTAAAPSCVVN